MTASVAFAEVCVVPHLPDFRAAFPGISVELTPSDANLDLAGQETDLAIRLAAAPQGDLVATRLADTRYRVVATPGWIAAQGAPSAPRDLAHVDCLRFALPEFRTRWLFRRPGEAPFEVPVSGRLVIANALALRRAVREGLGPALLAEWLVAGDLASGRLVDLFPGHEATATTFDTGAWAL